MSKHRPLMSIDAAQRAIQSRAKPLEGRRVALKDALGCYLTEDVVSDLDYPPFDKALMDGYAVRSSDCTSAGAKLASVGSIAAGSQAAGEVQSGQCVQINTGAPIPPGADSVIPIEEVEVSPDELSVTCQASVKPDQYVSRRGEAVKAGDVILRSGVRIGPPQIAALAAVGVANPLVGSAIRSAILVTGDELVAVNEKPTGPQIRNSNGPMLRALLEQEGCEILELPVVGDDRDKLAGLIEKGLEADVLCISGGVSMGKYDFVPEVLESLGVQFHVRKIAIKPGRPTHYGTSPGGTHVFGLPGNPVSVLIGFVLCVRPLLGVLAGAPWQTPTHLPATLSENLGANGDRQAYLPAMLIVGQSRKITARVLPWKGSGDPFGPARANGFVVRPPLAEAAPAGAEVDCLPLTMP